MKTVSLAILAILAGELLAQPVDFENDLIPVFTKHGCNAGACHGAAIGRGGFRLSLYGGDPESDYAAIVRQVGGRRVNRHRPEQSLILLKPTENVAHEGGRKFDEDSLSARLLAEWIRQGARRQPLRRLTRVAILPKKHTAKSLGETVAMKAVAHYSDGSSRDVTRWTIFAAEDPSAVRVDAAELRILRRGRHMVTARYSTEITPVEVVAPRTDAKVDLTAAPRRNFIDEEILTALAALRLPVSPQIDDAAYLRRLTLDLTGRLPKPEKAKTFLADSAPDKRETLLNALLASPEFNQYWTLQFAKLLRIRPQAGDDQAASAYHGWLSRQIRDDVSYRELARTLILAMGDSRENGPPNFHRTTPSPRQQAEFVSELFMGVRLRCANCHNHPLDRWTQDDYHGLAAIFAKVESGPIVAPKPYGEVIHPRTMEPAAERIPGEHFLQADDNGRKQLADWLTDSDNPYFAKAVVNRLWKRMMGRGLVEPSDDFRASNPATHPLLLDKLAKDFAAHGYRLRRTLSLIARSAAYARSANASLANKDDDRFYSHALRRPLEPEVLADAISDVLGVPDRYGDSPLGARAVELVDPRTPSPTLDILGRCGRETSCESSPNAVGGLPQKLHLFNGALLNARIAVEGGRLHRLQTAGESPREIVREFYLAAFSRLPTSQEKRHWQDQLRALKPVDRQAFLEDFVWGLTTCRDFVTNH